MGIFPDQDSRINKNGRCLKVKIRQNYTLDLNLVQRLNIEIRNQRKSQFVEDAIRNKLNGKRDFTLGDMDDETLLGIILSRNYQRDGTNALNPVLYAAIKLVLENNS